MTRKLFWENPYETQFEAKIIALREEGIVLDQTLFYPKSGGQAGDRGTLRAGGLLFEVDKALKKKNEIIHHISSDSSQSLNVGELIIGNIDWEYRYGIMKAHSSQHIFSAIILQRYNIETSQVYIEFEDVALNLDQKISYKQLKSALQEINEITVLNNREIAAKLISLKEAEKMSNQIRGQIPKHDQIRLIQAENCDLVCCGGTHVKNSLEIGPLIIYSFKKGKEVKYLVGKKAINMISQLNSDLLNSAELLGQPMNKIKDAIENQNIFISKLQKDNMTLVIETLRIISKNPILKLNNISIYIIEFEIDNKILNKEFKNFPLNSLLIIRSNDNRIKVLSKNKEIIANDIIQYLIGKYGGKGGGSDQSAQALLDKTPEDILSDLKAFLPKK
jgi:alanyl-tRNA synthetase